MSVVDQSLERTPHTMYSTRFDADKKVWFGPSTEFEISKTENFGEIILENLNDTDTDRVMQIDGDTGESLTKAEIRRRTIRCAQNLTKLGCTQNDCIGIVARNHHNLTPLLYGALCIGAPISPLDVTSVNDGISAILQRVRPSFIFCDGDVLKSIRATAGDIGLKAKLFTVNGSVDGFDSINSLISETGEEDSFVCSMIDDSYSHAAVIGCSSGSTGLPKSICLSHAFFSYRLYKTQIFGFPLMTLNFSSMYWISGVLSILCSAFNFAHIFTKKPFSADLFFDLVEKHKVQFFSGPPSQVQMILASERCENADLSSLLLCFMVGSTLPPVLYQKMKKYIPKCTTVSAYGMTEVCGVVSCTVPNELDECPNSSGRLVAGTEIKIIDQNTGEKCGIGEEGEIYIKTLIPPMGYYKDEVATRNSYDSEGYFITGDLGYFDDSGRLRIIGRKKEIFKSRRFAVWPAELENIILKHTDIQDVSVVSVYDDEILSELPAAAVVKKKGSSITADDVYVIVADQLAEYKRLDGGIYFLDELPLTASGKIIKSKVKEIAQKSYQLKKQTTKN